MRYSKLLIMLLLLVYSKSISQISTINETNKSAFNTEFLVFNEDINSNHIENKINNLKQDSVAINASITALKTTIESLDQTEDDFLEKNELLLENQNLLANNNIVLKIYNYYDLDNEIKKRAIEIYELRIKQFDDKIKAIKDGLNTAVNEFDYLKTKKAIKVLNAQKAVFNKNYLLLLEEKIAPSVWMPSKGPFFRAYFFETYYNETTNNTSYLNSLSYINSDSSSLISTELVSDNIGYFRLSFGSAISFDDSSASSDEKKNIEKLINAGGNFYLDVTLPIVSTYNSRYLTYYGFTNLKVATNINGFDSDIDNTNFNASFGVKNYFSIASDKKQFLFSFLIDSNLHYGSNDLFKSLDIKKQVLFNTNFVAYLTISEKYRIALRTNLASHPNLRTERVAFGLQLLK